MAEPPVIPELDEAAELLRAARESNEVRAVIAGESGWRDPAAAAVLAETLACRIEIASGLTRIAEVRASFAAMASPGEETGHARDHHHRVR